MTVFEKVMKGFEAEKNKPVHQVIQYPYTIENQKKYVIDEIQKKERLSFSELLQAFPTRIGLIFNFLAILELLAYQHIGIHIGEGSNNFWVTKVDAAEVSSAPGES
jgi:segregation and condensation protein A